MKKYFTFIFLLGITTACADTKNINLLEAIKDRLSDESKAVFENEKAIYIYSESLRDNCNGPLSITFSSIGEYSTLINDLDTVDEFHKKVTAIKELLEINISNEISKIKSHSSFSSEVYSENNLKYLEGLSLSCLEKSIHLQA